MNTTFTYLEYYRRRLGLTQAQLAKILGVGLDTIRLHEHPRSRRKNFVRDIDEAFRTFFCRPLKQLRRMCK